MEGCARGKRIVSVEGERCGLRRVLALLLIGLKYIRAMFTY